MAIELTEHKQFDLETQLQLDRMWDAWSRFDRAGDYLNDKWVAQLDNLWAQYEKALEAAYYAHAQAEAAQIIARHGDNIRKQLGIAGYRQLSQRLTLVQRRQQLQAVQ